MLIKKRSSINNTGIFTNQAIKKGASFYQIPPQKVLTANHYQAAKIGYHKYIWDEEVLNYVNHSCSPNAYVNLTNLTLTALRDIKTGEEITCNYDLTEGEEGFHFVCNCRSRNCRKQIGEVIRQT